jgi:hypothetical protein
VSRGAASVAALAALAVLVGCGGGSGDDDTDAVGPDQSASEFLVEHVERSLKGQFARVWENLHPAHQDVVSKSQFNRCQSEQFEEEVGALPTDTKVEAVEEYDESVEPPGGLGTLDTKAVTLRISSESAEEAATDTSHAVMVDGNWKWFLDHADFEAYSNGDCPD